MLPALIERLEKAEEGRSVGKRIAITFAWALVPWAVWTFAPLVSGDPIAWKHGLVALFATWPSLYGAYERLA